jgi:hypothetical protein
MTTTVTVEAYRCDECGRMFFSSRGLSIHGHHVGHTVATETDHQRRERLLREEK